MKTFWNKCIEHYKVDHFFQWQVSLEKTRIDLELLTDVDMLLMKEKAIRGGICHAIHWYATESNRYMKNYNQNKDTSYLMYWDAKSYKDGHCRKKWPVNGFKYRNYKPNFDEKFIKWYVDSDRENILKIDVKYSKRLHNLLND